MPKKLKPNMSDGEFLETLKSNRPAEPFLLDFSFEDVGRAVDFWLNNVVLKMPVTVRSMRKRGSRYVIEVSVITG